MSRLHSMTAFARGEARASGGTLIVELRSVNHRYLDCHFRIPDELRSVEPQLREALAGRLSRGKIECTLKLQGDASGMGTPVLNEELLARVIEASESIAARLGRSAALDPLALLQHPGVFQPRESDSQTLNKAAVEAFELALGALQATRAAEGEQLERLITSRLDAMLVEVERVRRSLPQLQRELSERLRSRLASLDVEVDSGRLEQEMAYLAQKSDVAEELDRLDTHIKAVRQSLHGGSPCGRRLDFLMQELHREANTLGSKSADAALTGSAIELKVLIEQVREQVQNIE